MPPRSLPTRLSPPAPCRKALTRYQISNKAAKQCSLHSAKWCVSSAHTRSLLQKGNLSHTFVAYRSVTRFTLRSSATADRGGHWLCPSAVCADVGGRAR